MYLLCFIIVDTAFLLCGADLPYSNKAFSQRHAFFKSYYDQTKHTRHIKDLYMKNAKSMLEQYATRVLSIAWLAANVLNI